MKITQEKANEIVKLINTEESGETTKVVISQGRYYPKDIPDFVMLFQKLTEQAIENLSPGACKVLLHFLCKLQYSNHIGMDQITIAENCKVSIITVARAIKELLRLQIIIAYKDLQDKRRNIYIINPHNAWKGKIKERSKAIKTLVGQYKLNLPEHQTL